MNGVRIQSQATSSVCRQSRMTSWTVPKETGPAVLMQPWKASRPPKVFLRYVGDMLAASGCSTPLSRLVYWRRKDSQRGSPPIA